MGITPRDPAHFDPVMGDYKDLKPFRMWCQKVLPLVYDESLSYYEVLCKLVDYLNKTMEDVGVLHDDVDALHTAYQQLQSYVNDYFSTLDVQEEINNKLDTMAEDGTFDRLLLPLFADIQTTVDGQNVIITQQSEKIATLEGRMDTFTNLPEGSTTGDAELTDIRVAENGITYPTAGDSVRGQVASIKERLSVTENALTATYPNIWNCNFSNDSFNGITLTRQVDGTYTVTGTATGLFYKKQTITLPPGRYNINGFTDGASNTYHLWLVIPGRDNIYQVNGWLDNTVVLDEATEIEIYLRVLQNTTVNTLFKPIIVNNTDYITKLNYVPYGFPYYDETNTIANNFNYIKNRLNTTETALSAQFPNVWNCNFTSDSFNGITLTRQDNGTYTVTGTATGLFYKQQTITLPPGRYNINGFMGGTSNTYHLLISIPGTPSVYQVNSWLNNDIVLDEETEIDIFLRVLQNTTVNTIFKPIILNNTEYTNKLTYVQYGYPYYNETIDEKINDQSYITGYTKPNLFNNMMKNTTYNGVTYTVNDDYSVTMSGISTGLSFQEQSITLPRGKYIVNGCNDGASNTYHIMIIRNGSYFIQYGGIDQPFEIIEETETFRLLCRVASGVNINTTMYPMIRSATVTNPTYAPYGKYQIYKPIQQLINYTQFNWSGYKMNVIGDSIVQGGYGNFITPTKNILNLSEARNYGVGGCLMASSEQDDQYPPVVLRYNNMDLDAQIIVVHAGTNDYSHQIPLGAPNTTDITTFNGALNVIMTGLRGMYPTALIIFDSILHRYNDEALPIKCNEYRNAIKDRCEANHMVFYDCFRYSGFDFVQGYYDHILTPDGLHLNQTGANILGRKLAGFINWN